jgi:carbonic anhydrase
MVALNIPLIVVLWAMKVVTLCRPRIDAVDHHRDFSGHIQLLTSDIAPAVRAASDTSAGRLIYMTKVNIIMTVERLRTKTLVLDYFHDQKKILIIAGIYHLRTGRVELVA